MKAQELKQGDYIELDMNGAKLYGKVFRADEENKMITLEIPTVFADISLEMLNRGEIKTITERDAINGHQDLTILNYRHHVK